MGTGNVVLNRRKNCSPETVTPVAEEPAFWEKQKQLGSADEQGSPGHPIPSAASPLCPCSPLPTGLVLALGVHEQGQLSQGPEEPQASCSSMEVIYQGPSMPRAKLQVQPQARMGYPEGFTAVRETTHLPGRFPAEHGRWQVCPFWPPTQNLSTQGCGCRGSSAPVPQCPQSRPAARVTPCQKTPQHPKQILSPELLATSWPF